MKTPPGPAAGANGNPARAADINSPVFLLAGGRRTGSTLLQRLLISSAQVLVWGEHSGVIVSRLMSLVQDMKRWHQSGAGAKEHFTAFQEQGFNAWIPNMNPDLSHFSNGCRALLEESLGKPARRLNYPRWGFKEVRYGARAALFLQSLYPGACFVLLVRDPESCLRSIKATQWGERVALKDGPLPFLLTWAKLSEGLLEASSRLKHAALIRYEDVLGDTGAVVQRLAAVSGIPAADFRTDEVLAYRDGGPGGKPDTLDAQDQRALGHDLVRRVAAKLGYD